MHFFKLNKPKALNTNQEPLIEIDLDSARENDIETGSTTDYQFEGKFNCTICLEEDLDANDKENPIKMLKCNHTFCSECF
jgi:ariadne-1